jgi:hypothetical protein
LNSQLRRQSMSNQAKRQYWATKVAKAKQRSGSLSAFCRAEGISINTFQYWQKRFNKEMLMPQPDRGRFLPVEIVDEPAQANTSRRPDPRWLAEFILHLHGGELR